jgi:hypothetical protein
MISHIVDVILGIILLWIGNDKDIKHDYIILGCGGWLASSILYLFLNG